MREDGGSGAELCECGPSLVGGCEEFEMDRDAEVAISSAGWRRSDNGRKKLALALGAFRPALNVSSSCDGPGRSNMPRSCDTAFLGDRR